MSQHLVPYTPPAPLRSPILLNPPDSVPPTDELEAVQAELKALKQRTLERAKKADDDLKALEVAMKKMREKEKGKGKAKVVTKVKREPSYTPSLDANDRGYTPSGPPSSAHGTSSSASVPIASASSSVPKLSQEARKVKKKEKDKKRKRDDDSDIEEFQRPRKMSPLPPAPKEPFHPKPSKLGASHKSAASQSFDLYTSSPLLPQRPRPPPPPVPGPSKPTEVTEDFSKMKAPPQTQIQTFYASIDPWIRNIREEDVGWLEYTADETEPFIIPPLGRHYTEVYEEEEAAIYGTFSGILDSSIPRRSNTLPGDPLPKWDPTTITETDLTSEKGHGPVTERLLSALLPAPNMPVWQAVQKAEEAYEAKMPGSTSGATTKSVNGTAKDDLNVADFETRVRDTARYYGLLDREPDFSKPTDDPVSTALRQAQRQLRAVIAANKARKARLVDIARDRLAYQEYLEARDSIDKNIMSTFTKMQKKDGPKVNKKKKKGEVTVNGNGTVNGSAPGAPLPNPASLGLGPDEEGKLLVPDSLQTLVENRRQWVDIIGGAFEEKQREFPGRVYGLPSSSVYEGVEDEVAEELQMLRLSIPPGKAADDLILKDFRTANASHSEASTQMVMD